MMIDRDSYLPGISGEADFLRDARSLLAMVHAYVVLDRAFEASAACDDAQRLFDGARRGMAASAVDEIGAACDLFADIAREIGAPIEAELRAAKRLLDLTYDEASARELPPLRPIQATLFDPTEIPEFRSPPAHA